MNTKCISNCAKTKNSKIVNPLTLDVYENKEKICITKPFRNKDNKIIDYKFCEKDEIEIKEITKIMLNPVLQFGSDILLSFYDINNLDELINWVYQKLKTDTPKETINRIVNCYFKINGKYIKKIDSKIYSLFHEIWFYKMEPKKKYDNKKFYNILLKTFKENINEEEVSKIKFNIINILKNNLKKYYRE